MEIREAAFLYAKKYREQVLNKEKRAGIRYRSSRNWVMIVGWSKVSACTQNLPDAPKIEAIVACIKVDALFHLSRVH